MWSPRTWCVRDLLSSRATGKQDVEQDAGTAEKVTAP